MKNGPVILQTDKYLPPTVLDGLAAQWRAAVGAKGPKLVILDPGFKVIAAPGVPVLTEAEVFACLPQDGLLEASRELEALVVKRLTERVRG